MSRLFTGHTETAAAPQYPAGGVFQYAEPAAAGASRRIEGLDELAGLGRQLFDLPDVPTDDALFRQASRRMIEQHSPRLAARGVLTSGPGINAEQQALEELGVAFGERSFERGIARQGAQQEALAGLAAMKALPIEMQTKLLQAIFSQEGIVPAAYREPSVWENIIGPIGGAIGNYMGGGGGGGYDQ